MTTAEILLAQLARLQTIEDDLDDIDAANEALGYVEIETESMRVELAQAIANIQAQLLACEDLN